MRLAIAFMLVLAQPAIAAELVGGAPDPRDAVVRVTSSVGSCTGTYVGEGRVVTAAHCVPDGELAPGAVLVGFVIGAETTVLASHDVVRDPVLDLALVVIDGARLPSKVTPIPVLPPDCALSAADLGEVVVLVGFGAQEAPLGVDERQGGLSTLASVEDEHLTVASSATQARACFGDSGGPVLVTRAGREYVAGALSTGAADCSGIDHYVRLDAGRGAALVEEPASGGCASGGGGSPGCVLLVLALVRNRCRRTRVSGASSPPWYGPAVSMS